jgi:threonine dehydratase
VQVARWVGPWRPVYHRKGRGADFRLRSMEHGQRVVCASADDFGQAIANVARRQDVAVEVFAATT